MDQTLSSSSAHVSTLIDSNSNSRTNGSISNGSRIISPNGNDSKKVSPKTKTNNKSNTSSTTNNKTHEVISLIDSSQEFKESHSINDDDGKHSNSNTGKRMGDNSPNTERNAKTIKVDDEKETIQAVQEQGGSRGHLGATSGMKVLLLLSSSQ